MGATMIEHCSNLLECERTLAEAAEDAILLGGLPLTEADLERLASLISEQVGPDIAAGTRFLEEKAPTSLACYLVWRGIFGYDDGDYWSAVQEDVALPLNWQTRWGQLFLDYLRAREAPDFSGVEGAHKYVTPILTHGGIPNSNLSEFFEDVLLPLVQRVLIEPADRGEIAHELDLWRADNRARLDLERQAETTKQQREELIAEAEELRQALEAYNDVAKVRELEETIEDKELSDRIEGDVLSHLDAVQERTDELEARIRELESKRDTGERWLARFQQRYGHLVDHADNIQQVLAGSEGLSQDRKRVAELKEQEKELHWRLHARWEKIAIEPWREQYGPLLSQVSHQELRLKLEEVGKVSREEKAARDTWEQSRATLEELSRRRPALATVAGLLVLLILLAGAVLFRSLPLALSALGLLTLLVLAGMSQRRQAVQTHHQFTDLQQKVATLESKRQNAVAEVANILGSLPIQPELLTTLDSNLHHELETAAAVWQELNGVRDKRKQLEQKIQQLTRRLKRLAKALGVEEGDSIEGLGLNLKQELKTALQKNNLAEQVRKTLASKVRPRLAQLKEEHEVARNEMDVLEQRLTRLGEGSYELGVEKVRRRHELRARLERLQQKLQQRYGEQLPTIERRIAEASGKGQAKPVLQERLQQVEEKVEEIDERVEALNQALSLQSTVLSGVDEPIRRYLLYGGQPASIFLAESASLLQQTLDEGVVTLPEELNLPPRVIDAFERWWDEYQSLQSIEPERPGMTAGTRYAAPRIFLEPEASEIMVRLPAQRLEVKTGAPAAAVEIDGGKGATRGQSLSLRVYQHSEDLVETQKLEFPLPWPADDYAFRLRYGADILQQWQRSLKDEDKPYIAFDRRSGNLLKEQTLPKSPVWLVTVKDIVLEPRACVITEAGALHGRWKDFVLYELDLEQVDQLQLIRGDGPTFNVPVSPERPIALGLIDQQPMEGVESEGIEVYAGNPPSVRVPIEDTTELRKWRISVGPAGESSLLEWRSCRLDELDEIQSGQGWAAVSLGDTSLLGSQATGRFAVRFRKQHYVDWHATFCVIPDLSVEFAPEIILPYKGKQQPSVTVRVSVPEGTVFEPLPPAAQQKARDSSADFQIKATEDAIRANLHCHLADGNRLMIPLRIAIPKARWRIQGVVDEPFSAWQDTQAEEIWLSGWEDAPELYLLLRLPSGIRGTMSLNLTEEPSHSIERAIRNGSVRFDLLALKDVLNAGPSVRKLTISAPDASTPIPNAPLFSVRNRWEAEDIECVQSVRGQEMILKVRWVEKGKADDREIRLWRMHSPSPKPFLREPVKERGRAEIKLESSKLSPGEYLLELASVDPWSASRPIRPSVGSPNTYLLDIAPIGELRVEQIFSIRAVITYTSEEHSLPRDAYRIKIAGKIAQRRLPEGIEGDVRIFENEGWYVGTFDASSDPEIATEVAAANPVKFEYREAQNVVKDIEDRYGDGAMYCTRCGKLYWRQSRLQIEEAIGHRNYLRGPNLRFKIHWEQ